MKNFRRKIAGFAAASAMALTVIAPTAFNVFEEIRPCSITASAEDFVMTDAEYQRGLYVYNYLKSNTSWNDGAICGVLAHLYTESRFIPTVVNTKYSTYGLCQWKDERKANLMKLPNYSNIDVQLNFMINEINNINYYKFSKNAINSATNDANGAYNTAYYVRLNYGWGNYGTSTTDQFKIDDCTLRALEARDIFYMYAEKNTYLAGDINLDGKVDVTDVSYLSLYLLGDTTFDKIAGNAAASKANADVTGDGTVNVLDLAALKRIVIHADNSGPVEVTPYTKRLAKGTPIYAEPGSSKVNQYIKDENGGTYTITKEQTVNGVKYGYLKSGAGWVKL